MPSTWASPMKFARAAPTASPTRRASSGTTLTRRARRQGPKPPSPPSSAWGPASLNSTPAKLVAKAWAHATAAAEKWNQPGVFTTLHGFEWTSAPGGKNLHRTVIFRDNLDRVKQIVPYSALRQPGSGGPVEVHGRLRHEDRRLGAGHPAQPELERGHHVHGGDLRGKTDGPGLCRGAHPPRAADGGDAGQG